MSSAALKNRQLRPRRGDHVGNAFPAEAGGTSDAGGMNRVIPIQSCADDLVYPRRRIVGQHHAVRTVLVQVAIIDEGKPRSEEHTSELQSLMRISYAVFCLK